MEFTDTSHFKGDNKPVEMTTYTSAVIYCNERSLEEGLTPCYDEKRGTVITIQTATSSPLKQNGDTPQGQVRQST